MIVNIKQNEHGEVVSCGIIPILNKEKTTVICYHQTRDMATPGFRKLSRDIEKKIPRVVFLYSTFWGLCIMNSYF